MKQKIDCNWHRYVDLGLPSGLLWATCNIGANEPWEDGLYFSWGNVDGHAYGSGYDFGRSNDWPYASTPGAALINNIPVNTEYDAARASLGGSWRMPTASEFQELNDNCTSECVTQYGVNGRMFTSKINGNSVFFPSAGLFLGSALFGGCAGGYYWSSSFLSQSTASNLAFDNSYVYPQYFSIRFYGFPVRAVLDHPKNSLMIKTIKR